ncbi:MAG TPA: hypothetical protein VHR16_04785 [Candidatus Limnocylindrales bacterium]|nr:hypothetical protein [Candidatus Limnocylindrales bacterium]
MAALWTDDFTVRATIEVPERPDSGLGDIAAAYDPAARRGWTLGFLDASPCGNHPNDRELCFTLDAGTAPEWTDLGRPSAATIMVAALAVLDGALYAATWEGPPSDRGHVYRLDPDGWTDCGSPWDCNAVTRLAVHDGSLFAAVSRLRGGGSGLADSANQEPGGRVLRYDGGSDWTDLGRLGDADSVAALVPWRGELYAIPMYSEGLFRLDAPGQWTWCGSPGRRLLALGVHDGALYGAGNDHADVVSAIAQTAAGIVVPARSAEGGGGIFRYDGGEAWTSLGLQRETTQVYSIETFDGAMHIGTWPSGLVYRHGGETRWESCGRLGDETEVMNLLAFGGSLYGGTLPKAQVFRMDGADHWAEVGRLDRTPDVLYRRAASMAVHRGQVAIGTLPSGGVHAMRVGHAVSTGRAIEPGTHDVVAHRRGATLELSLDGALVASESDPRGAPLDLGVLPDVVTGGGPRARFRGRVERVDVSSGAMSAAAIAAMPAGSRPA